MSTQLRAWWPIYELTADLTEQAGKELPQVAARAHARVIGSPRWHILPGRSVPGAAAYAWVLMVLVEAEHVDNMAAARRAWKSAMSGPAECTRPRRGARLTEEASA